MRPRVEARTQIPIGSSAPSRQQKDCADEDTDSAKQGRDRRHSAEEPPPSVCTRARESKDPYLTVHDEGRAHVPAVEEQHHAQCEERHLHRLPDAVDALQIGSAALPALLDR